MKKLLVLLVVLLIFTYLVSCQSKETESLEIVFNEIVLILPDNWLGNYTSYQELIREGDATADFIWIYHTKTRELLPDGGELFCISRRTGHVPQEEIEEWAGNSEVLYVTEDYTYILSIPTDVQYLTPNYDEYNKNIVDEYFMLVEQLPEIKASVKNFK